MEPEVTDAMIAEFEQRRSLKIYKCSAKSGLNVETTFLKLTETLINNT